MSQFGQDVQFTICHVSGSMIASPQCKIQLINKASCNDNMQHEDVWFGPAA